MVSLLKELMPIDGRSSYKHFAPSGAKAEGANAAPADLKSPLFFNKR